MTQAMIRSLVFVVWAVMALPSVAEACSCVGTALATVEQKRRDVARHLEGSEAVFLGQITALNAEWVEFRVIKVWKGRLGSSVLVGTPEEREPGGLIRSNTCIRRFGTTAGVSFIVFANGASPGLLTASSCGRSANWEEGEELEAFLNDLATLQGVRPVDPWWPDRREIVGEVLDAIDFGSVPTVTAGQNLDPLGRTAVAEWLSAFSGWKTRGRPPILRSSPVVVEAVYGARDEARVLLTAGTVPDIPRSSCGVSMFVPLRRAGRGWTVVADRISANCANLGVPPIMLSARTVAVQEREVLLLTLSHLGLGNGLQFAASSSTRELLKKALEDLGPVLDGEQVGDEQIALPSGHFLIQTLRVKDGVALVEGTLGPARRIATLACGTSYRVKLLAIDGGWRITETTVTEC